jgi:hypothetical protein
VHFLRWLWDRLGWTRYAPDSLGDKYLHLCRAILHRRQVQAVHSARPVLFCPHALGFCRGEAYVLAYRHGESEATDHSRSDGGWVWIRIVDLHGVRMCPGPWRSGSSPAPPLTGFEAKVQAA